MTVDEAFAECLSRIELNPARVAAAATHYSAIKSALEAQIAGSRVRQIGSFQRRTKIRPQGLAGLADALDIDIIATIGTATKFAPPGSGTFPQQALERIKSALTGHLTYKAMSPRIDAPVVSISYADNIAVEIVPAFINLMVPERNLADDIRCYLIGTSSGTWIPADYDYDAKYITAGNTLSEQFLVPTSKLMKTFFRNLGLGVKSFYTEVLCALTVPPLIQDWRRRKYTFSQRHVFAHTLSALAGRFGDPRSLPGSNSLPVSSGLNGLGLIRAKMMLGPRATSALNLTKVPNLPAAVASWGKLIGAPFPQS